MICLIDNNRKQGSLGEWTCQSYKGQRSVHEEERWADWNSFWSCKGPQDFIGGKFVVCSFRNVRTGSIFLPTVQVKSVWKKNYLHWPCTCSFSHSHLIKILLFILSGSHCCWRKAWWGRSHFSTWEPGSDTSGNTEWCHEIWCWAQCKRFYADPRNKRVFKSEPGYRTTHT